MATIVTHLNKQKLIAQINEKIAHLKEKATEAVNCAQQRAQQEEQQDQENWLQKQLPLWNELLPKLTKFIKTGKPLTFKELHDWGFERLPAILPSAKNVADHFKHVSYSHERAWKQLENQRKILEMIDGDTVAVRDLRELNLYDLF